VNFAPRETQAAVAELATKIFADVDEALAYFESAGMFAERDLFGN